MLETARLSRSFLGTAYQPHDASAISCRLPSELPDETFDLNFAASTSSSYSTPPLRSTSALHSICLTLAKISRALASARLPSPVELRALQDDLAATTAFASDDSGVKPFHEVLRSYAYVKLARGLVNLEDRAGENGGSHYRAVTVQHACEWRRLPAVTRSLLTQHCCRLAARCARLGAKAWSGIERVHRAGLHERCRDASGWYIR